MIVPWGYAVCKEVEKVSFFTTNINKQQVYKIALFLLRKLNLFNIILFVPEYSCPEQFCSGQHVCDQIPRLLNENTLKIIQLLE